MAVPTSWSRKSDVFSDVGWFDLSPVPFTEEQQEEVSPPRVVDEGAIHQVTIWVMEYLRAVEMTCRFGPEGVGVSATDSILGVGYGPGWR